MAQEDWEKELLSQLGDIKPNAPKLPSSTEKPVAITPPNVNPPKNQQDSSTWLFLVMLFVLAASIVYVYDDKTGGKIKNTVSQFISNSISYKKEEKNEFPSDAEIAKVKSDFEKFKAENKATIDSIQAKLNTNSTKIGLMGLLLNENFTMIMRNADTSDFVFFNRDWTLDRIPKFIELTEDDKEYLKKYISNKD